MPKQTYVVQYNDQTDLYMIEYNSQYSLCRWGTLSNPDLMQWATLAAAQAVATSINGGTVGTTKPQN